MRRSSSPVESPIREMCPLFSGATLGVDDPGHQQLRIACVPSPLSTARRLWRGVRDTNSVVHHVGVLGLLCLCARAGAPPRRLQVTALSASLLWSVHTALVAQYILHARMDR